MTCNIFIPYYDFNDDKFDVSNFYNDGNDYIKALENYSMTENEMMSVDKKNDEFSYAKCECVLHNENDEDMSIDELVSYYNKKEMIMMVFNLNPDTADDEFDMELSSWLVEHSQIEKLPIKDDEKFISEPKRDLKLIFKNKMNIDTYCELINVRIIDKVDVTKYVVLVENVIFTKKF